MSRGIVDAIGEIARVVVGVCVVAVTGACVQDVPEEGADDEDVEFRSEELQCLSPVPPNVLTPVTAQVAPGDLVLFQGHLYAVPGGTPDLETIQESPEDVPVLSIGDTVLVVRPQGNYKIKAVGVDAQSRMRLVPAGTLDYTVWTKPLILVQHEECLDEVENEFYDCVNITEDMHCCEGLETLYASFCANNPFYDVPNTAGEVWAETCGLQPIGGHTWHDVEQIDVRGMSCSYTGWAFESVAEISNGFLYACQASNETLTGCQTF